MLFTLESVYSAQIGLFSLSRREAISGSPIELIFAKYRATFFVWKPSFPHGLQSRIGPLDLALQLRTGQN